MRRLLVLALLLALPAACGGDEAAAPATTGTDTTAPTTTETEPEPSAEMTLSVYLLRNGQVAAASRSVPETQAVAWTALRSLIDGPTPEERDAGLSSAVPASTRIEALTIADGTAVVELSSCQGLAQIVYTLTQFPSVDVVETSCVPGGLTRASFEDDTPPIFLESPTVGEEVESPLRIVGTANTYEATFMYELEDVDGKVVAKDFVTATSGSGTRGTFKISIPFEVDAPGGSLTLYESSAEDGSRIHVVKLPLDLQPG